MPVYELIAVTEQEDWDTCHKIRQEELWNAKHLTGYDRNHQGNHIPENISLLLKRDGTGIATVRFDLQNNNTAIIRLVAVTSSEQGKGVGGILNAHILDFAKANNVNKILVNAFIETIGYYKKMGFQEGIWDQDEYQNTRVGMKSVQMSISL